MHELRKFQKVLPLEEETFLVLEGTTDKELKELIAKDWKTSNSDHSRQVFKNDSLSEEEYTNLADIISRIRHSEDYASYKKDFDKLCSFCHIVPRGTIITRLELKSGSKENKNSLFVEYAANTRKIKLPDGVALYHVSKVGGIKELIPVFRGKSAKGFLYDKPRIYLTIHKDMPKFLADYHWYDKLHKYKVKVPIRDVYVDPLVWNGSLQGAVYVETNKSIPVDEVGIKKDKVQKESVEVIEEGFFSRLINAFKKRRTTDYKKKSRSQFRKDLTDDKKGSKTEISTGLNKGTASDNNVRKEFAKKLIDQFKPYVAKLNANTGGTPFKLVSVDDEYNIDFWKAEWFDDDGKPDYSDELQVIDFDCYDIPGIDPDSDNLENDPKIEAAFSNFEKYVAPDGEMVTEFKDVGTVYGEGSWDYLYVAIEVKKSAIKQET